MSPPAETVRHRQPLESLESEPETRFTPPVEMSLGNLDIPPNTALRTQAGEIESFQPLDLNCENTMSTLTIPELLESLDFRLEGGIATLPVPLQGPECSLSNWHSSLFQPMSYPTET